MLKTRRYIRHPAGVPIQFSVTEGEQHSDTVKALALRDVSEGGLCFSSARAVEPGSSITIQIPIESPPFQAQGVVAWCRPEGGRYAVGVRFDDITRFGVRMVEQVCHIERYRDDVRQIEGRQLSSEEAAQEWVSRFAEEFPGGGS